VNSEPSPLSARRGVMWLVVSAVAFGSLVVLIKAAVQAGVNAETALALRFTLATLIWWLILLARRQLPRPGVRQTLPALALGALVYAPNGLAYYLGTARVSGSLAAMAVAVVPVVVALLAWLLLRERLGWLGRMALVLAVGGGALLAGAPEGRPDTTALALLGGSLFLYSLYIVVSTPVTRASSPRAVAAYVFAGAALMYWLWGGLTGRLDFGFAPGGWAAVFGLAVIPTVLAMLTFLAGVRIVGPTRAAIVGALEPLTGVLLSVLLLGDRPGALQVAGGGLIIGAAVLVQWERVRERARPAAS
jgi:drug/metabolite transporter (DMT)-like permease